MQLFQNIGFLDLGEGEMGRLGEVAVGGYRAIDLGRGSQVESMASRRKMLIEIIDYHRFIGGDSVS